jgi:CRP-like cAMP-binding protein
VISSSDSIGPEFRNEVLASLPLSERARLRPLLTPTRWVSGQPLYEAGEIIQHVYFVEQGFASSVVVINDANRHVEVGLTGREGVVGAQAFFDREARSYDRVYVQMPGVSYRMSADSLRESVQAMPEFRARMSRALQAYMAQTTQTAACNSQHTMLVRLTRWLLMAHDRAEGNELNLTHEFLSVMLGVRRSGVTAAIGQLQNAGLIQNRRGHVVITDRAGLEAATCLCYRRVRTFADTIMGPKRTAEHRPQCERIRIPETVG